MRARQADTSGVVTRDGVRVAYEVFGEGHPHTIVLMPTWAIADAGHWKGQVPVLAQRYRVVVVDGRGNGKSDRPTDPSAYALEEYAADVVAVMDEVGVQTATIAGVSNGGVIAIIVAATYPERVTGAFLVAPSLGELEASPPGPEDTSFDDELETYEGWALYNQHAWRRDLTKFAGFFWHEVFNEPHSTKPIEDAMAWTAQTDAETLIATNCAVSPTVGDAESRAATVKRVQCPTMIVHGLADGLIPATLSGPLAELLGADLLFLEGSGHCPQARDPIRVNRALLDFVDRVTPAAERPARRMTWTRAMSRPKRVLYLSSPIGLGHARRDLAIARALREREPAVQIDWLAQEPVTTVLAAADETVHSASGFLAGESAHFASEAHEHDLHAFQAVRRMDEILVTNFSVFQDVIDSGDYDLVVGDESWDVDYFWHENPELKRAAYAWMTDFVGWLPMPDGGDAEAALTADYNAEMLEHVARFRRIRDCSVFVGDPDDIVADDFGPGLPSIRDWTTQHYDFAGYITGFDPAELADRGALRARLGYPVDNPVVVVTVGGSGIGEALLRKVIDAYPTMRDSLAGLRMIAVAGPRIDPKSLPSYEGVEVRGYVPDLHLHLAACDGAIVQGGLTSTMELVANRRPFLYFPLGHHFEQQRHVRHRLERHRAGRCMDYLTSDAEAIAAALMEQMAAPCSYLPVPADGADRAAGLLARLL